MLFTLPDDILHNVLQRLPLADRLNLISTQKRLYRQPGLDELQAHIGVLRFHESMQRYDFSRLQGAPRKLAVMEREKAQQHLLFKFDARYHAARDSKLLQIRKRLIVALEVTRRLLDYMDRPNVYVSVADDSTPGLFIRYTCLFS